MHIYLSARYGRKREMLEVADRLRKLGHVITARWIFAPDEAVLDEAMAPDRRWAFAETNLFDLLRSDAVVAFTEDGDVPGASRGGRHVEWGFCLWNAIRNFGKAPELFVVGLMENIFYASPDAKVFPDIDAFVAHVGERKSPVGKKT